MRRFAVAALAFGILLCACGDDEPAPVGGEDGGAGGGTVEPCAPGEIEHPLGCCPAGEKPLDDGSCQPAGVPADRCAVGFEHDGDAGCDPVLPAEPCESGLMAIMGESACRQIMDCGQGPWGDIPIDGTTQYVDATYAGNDSDGSETRPWITITEAVAAASAGAVIAVAAGSYEEDVVLSQAMRLWGRCPSMVELDGTAQGVAALLIRGGAAGAEVHGLAVTGQSMGVVVSAAQDVVLDRLWVHDLDDRGIDAENTLGPVSVTISDSLVERTRDSAIIVLSGTADIERTVVRETLPGGPHAMGRGLTVKKTEGSQLRSSVTLRGSLLDHNRDLGILLVESDLLVSGSVVRDTLPSISEQRFGRGLGAEQNVTTGERANVTVEQSYFQGNHNAAVYVLGSDATIEATVLRDTQIQPQPPDKPFGYGLDAELEAPPATPSVVHLTASLVQGNHFVGVRALGAEMHVESTVIRDTRAEPTSGAGRGFDLEYDDQLAVRSLGSLRYSVVEASYDTGVFVAGSDLTLDGTAVRDTAPSTLDSRFGRGVVVQHAADQRGSLTVIDCAVERSHDIAVVAVGSDLTVDHSLVRDTAPRASDGTRGRGIAVQQDIATFLSATFTVRRSRLTGLRDVGIFTLDADGLIEDTVVEQVGARQSDGRFGDAIAIALAAVEVRGVRAEGGQRAGITSFSSELLLGGSTLECNPIHLDAETLPAAGAPAPLFTDLGGNRCGCGGEEVVCQLLSSSLQVPEALPPVE